MNNFDKLLRNPKRTIRKAYNIVRHWVDPHATLKGNGVYYHIHIGEEDWQGNAIPTTKFLDIEDCVQLVRDMS